MPLGTDGLSFPRVLHAEFSRSLSKGLNINKEPPKLGNAVALPPWFGKHG